MKQNEVSIIISFYNKINFLKLVLSGLERQTFKNFEVIIADDGSSKVIIDELINIINNSKLDIIHIWHEDNGWRKNIILNKAILTTKPDYLIFIDGDCIPHFKFVEEHFFNKEQNTVLTGRRVNLPEKVTDILTTRKIKKGYLQHLYLIYSFILNFYGQGSHIENGIYIKSKFIRKFINNKVKGILGSNFSIHKKDLLDINGFDERFLFPAAGEDTDIENRLRNKGVIIKTLKHIAVQYHLYHRALERNKERLKILQENLENNVIYTPHGIIKYRKL